MKKLLLTMAAAFIMSATAFAQGGFGGGQGQFDPEQMIQMRTDRTVEQYKLNADQAKQLLELNTKYNDRLMGGFGGFGGGRRGGGMGQGGPGGGGSQKLIVYTSSTPTLSSDVTVSNGTTYFGGKANIGGTVTGGSNVTLTNYSSGGGPGGW